MYIILCVCVCLCVFVRMLRPVGLHAPPEGRANRSLCVCMCVRCSLTSLSLAPCVALLGRFSASAAHSPPFGLHLPEIPGPPALS